MAKHKHGKPHGEPDEPDDAGSIDNFGTVPTAPADPAAGMATDGAGGAGADPFTPAPAPVGSHGAAPNPAAGAAPPAPLKAVAMKKATVTMPGCPPVEVEYPADTPEPARHAVAKKAYMDAVGQWALPAEPHIELHD